MKQSAFIVILFFIALVAAFGIYEFILGNPANFADYATKGTKEVPLGGNIMGMVYVGGPLVALLICLSIMVFAIIIERALSLKKAAGKQAIPKFFKKVIDQIRANKINDAIASCDAQRGSVANVLKAALSRFQEVTSSGSTVDNEKKLVEVQRSVEESMMLETPLLEKNLIALSTIASIATMVGLLGTVIGMIRAFKALAQAGAPDAISLATGISEALINTAGGLFAAILGIVAYNFYVNKVDNFTYQIDEANYNVMQLLKEK
ncbi:MAG: MotA/TolQ/ExbB proton channel family protein [Ignavibacteriales bacterium]|nr:MotA/TolQ/ExbB proton channel family protein [Ignavibacteriales bacterium]